MTGAIQYYIMGCYIPPKIYPANFVSVEGKRTWQMRRGGQWVSSQCDYFLGRATDLGRFQHVSVQLLFCHDSDHCALVAKIRAGGGEEMKKYRQRY
jgi:hypothetical protein